MTNDNLNAFRGMLLDLQRIQTELKNYLTEAVPKSELRDREYKICSVSTFSGMGTIDPTREILPHTPVQPDEQFSYIFGVSFVTDAGIQGLPETEVRAFGIDRSFLFESLIVDNDCASHFEISNIFVGAQAMWHTLKAVPATRFSASSSRILFKCIAQKNVAINALVKNISKTPQVFRAKIVGKEPVQDMSEVQIKNVREEGGLQ